MKRTKRVSRQKRTIVFIAAVLLLTIVVIVLSFFMKQTKNNPTSSTGFDQQSRLDRVEKNLLDGNTLEGNSEGTSVVFEEEALESVMTDGLEISTPIGELYYSKVWEEYVEVKCNSENQGFTAVIQASIGNHQEDILAIHIGEKADGVLLGNVPDMEGNQTNVYLELYEIEMDNTWSQSEIDMVYAMQEGVNQIVEQIEQLYGYIPV